jgi:hypothetical protein
MRYASLRNSSAGVVALLGGIGGLCRWERRVLRVGVRSVIFLFSSFLHFLSFALCVSVSVCLVYPWQGW